MSEEATAHRPIIRSPSAKVSNHAGEMNNCTEYLLRTHKIGLKRIFVTEQVLPRHPHSWRRTHLGAKKRVFGRLWHFKSRSPRIKWVAHTDVLSFALKCTTSFDVYGSWQQGLTRSERIPYLLLRCLRNDVVPN